MAYEMLVIVNATLSFSKIANLHWAIQVGITNEKYIKKSIFTNFLLALCNNMILLWRLPSFLLQISNMKQFFLINIEIQKQENM